MILKGITHRWWGIWLSFLFLLPLEGRPAPHLLRQKPVSKQASPSRAAPLLSPEDSPWLIGTLIAPSGVVIPYGRFEIETYFFFNTQVGMYNNHWDQVSLPNFFSFNGQLFLFFGLTPWMDVSLVPQFFVNSTRGMVEADLGDISLALDFEILPPDALPYFPGIKLTVKETFPSGHFERLNPLKLFTDETGAGAYGTTFNLVFYKLHKIGNHRFYTVTYSLAYTLSSHVRVHGFNAYGGGFGTYGVVNPGGIFQAIVSFELTLTKNWALALDNVYLRVGKTSFAGTVGTTATGAPAKIGSPSSDQISFCPAIEYNFSSHLGIELGCWFSAWGRNSPVFRSAIFNMVYTY